MNNKKVDLLMIIGIIFIVLSGCIFVSSNWDFLTEIQKQFFIFGGMFVFFTGSVLSATVFKLEKTASALYYLGTASLGFLAYLITKINTDVEFWGGVSISLSFVIVAFFIKFLFEKRIMEFFLIYLLMVILSITVMNWTEGNFSALFVVWALMLMVLNVFYGFCKELGLSRIKKPLYIIHKIQFVIVAASTITSLADIMEVNRVWRIILDCVSISSLSFVFTGAETSFDLAVMVAPFMIITLITATTIDTDLKKLSFFRVINSLSIFILVYIINNCISKNKDT